MIPAVPGWIFLCQKAGRAVRVLLLPFPLLAMVSLPLFGLQHEEKVTYAGFFLLPWQ